MKKPIIVFLIVSIWSFSFASLPKLDLKKVVKLSLENNLDIEANNHAIAKKKAEYVSKSGEFDWNINGSYTFSNSNTPSASSLDGAVNSSVLSETSIYKASMSKKFGFGTTLVPSYTKTITESNSTSANFATSYEPEYGLTISQPLLRTFDFDYHVSEENEAELEWLAEVEKQKDAAEKIVYEAISAYTKAIEAKETVAIQEKTYELAKETLTQVLQKKKLGKASRVDVLDAKSKSLQSYEKLLDSQTNFNKKINELSLHTFGESKKIQIIWNDNLPNQISKPLAEITKVALKNRGEIKKSKFKVEKSRLSMEKSKTDKLPQINAEYDVKWVGLAGDSSGADKQVNDFKYKSWVASATMSYPIMGYAANSSGKIKKIQHEQELLKTKKAIQNIKLDISNNYYKFKSSKIRVDALKSVVEAETQKFNSQKVRHKNGKASTFDLLTSLKDREKAELDYLKSKMNYIKSYYNLARVRGVLIQEFKK